MHLPGRDFAFSYYDGAMPERIEPHYGPVKNPHNNSAIIYGSNFACAPGDEQCSHLVVRFGHEGNGTLERGTLISSTQIRVPIPKYTKPDVLDVAISFNAQDFTTKEGLTYGYFDPYLTLVKPKFLSPTNATSLELRGFGFVNSDPA